MLLSTIIVGDSTINGNGLIATQDIPCGCVIWLPCRSCKTWTSEEISGLSEGLAHEIDTYAYSLVNGDVLLPCHHAYMMNHSCAATTLDFGLEFGVAVSDIKAGEEATCDYRSFLNDPFWRIHCHCGSTECVGEFTSQDGRDNELIQQWITRLQSVLPLVKTVQQPLHDILMDCSPSYSYVRTLGRAYELGPDVSIRKPSFLGNKREKPFRIISF